MHETAQILVIGKIMLLLNAEHESFVPETFLARR